MSKHTPGPWKFCMYDHDTHKLKEVPFDYEPNRYWDNPGIYGANGRDVVCCDEYYIFSGPADVRLMCAAPELLKALQDIVVAHKGGFLGWGHIDAASDAIEKALGK